MEESEELVLATAANVMAAEEEGERDSDLQPLALPTYEDTTDDIVNKCTRSVFPGFEPSDEACPLGSPEEIADYMMKVNNDISQQCRNGDIEQRQTEGGCLGLYWNMAHKVDQDLTNSDYGKGTYNIIAARQKKSVPYIYQIRAVATRLTKQDAYLLGVRHCTRRQLRRLAQIKDDERRKLIIKTFVDNTKTFDDPIEFENQVKRFRAAIADALKGKDFAVEATSSPAMLDGPKVTEEYDNLMTAFSNLKKAFKILGDEETMTQIASAMGDFYLMDNVPDAEKKMATVKQDATYLKTTLESIMSDYLPQLSQDLDSLQHTELQKSEE